MNATAVAGLLLLQQTNADLLLPQTAPLPSANAALLLLLLSAAQLCSDGLCGSRHQLTAHRRSQVEQTQS